MLMAPRSALRRSSRAAHGIEDIGNADPRALALALQACEVYERLGSPEGELAIAQAVVFMACAAKSNAVYVAFGAAMEDAKRLGTLDVRCGCVCATGLAKAWATARAIDMRRTRDVCGRGEVLPDEMGRSLLQAGGRGLEIRIRRRWRSAGKGIGLGIGVVRSARTIAPRSCHSLRKISRNLLNMLDVRLLRTDPGAVARNLARRGFAVDVERLRALEERRKAAQVAADATRAARNAHARKVGQAKAQGQDIAALVAVGDGLARQLDGLDKELVAVQSEFDELALGLPNMLHESVPDGRDETANVEVRRWGMPREFDFTPIDHVAIGESSP
jgi:hypothetical protein